MQYDENKNSENRKLKEKWWLFGRYSTDLYEQLTQLKKCFVASVVTKHLNFSVSPTNFIFTNKVFVFTTERWDLYTLVQSSLHEVWTRKYSGTLATGLNYSPSDCFANFPFPEGIWQTANPTIADIGEHYHEYRRNLMLQLWLGLTDIYNLFHTRDLTIERVAKVSKKTMPEAEAGYYGIIELRRLHVELDIAVREAYGWNDLDLGHDFHEVETLPENDRVRYTISPTARKEVLKRLLAENHKRAAAEAANQPVKAVKSKQKKSGISSNGGLF